MRFEIGLVKVVKQQYRVQFSTSRRMTFDKKRIIYRHIIYKFHRSQNTEDSIQKINRRDCYSSQALLFCASVFVHLVMISAI